MLLLHVGLTDFVQVAWSVWIDGLRTAIWGNWDPNVGLLDAS